MSQPFVAEIRIFAFNFAPKGWAFCAGQILPLSQNTALFSLLGTTYGGDGKSNFALPNLQGSVPIEQGQGPGLSLYDLGQQGGSENVTLLQTELPGHNHTLVATTTVGTTQTANGSQLARGMTGNKQNSNIAKIYSPNANLATKALGVNAMGFTGSSFPHNNMMPYLTLNFCIALQGVFPPRG
jgi:microcystin-dependent protein